MPVGVCYRCWVCLLIILQSSCYSGRFSVSASSCLMPETASPPQCWTSWVLLSWPTQPQCLLGMWVLLQAYWLITLCEPNPFLVTQKRERDYQKATAAQILSNDTVVHVTAGFLWTSIWPQLWGQKLKVRGWNIVKTNCARGKGAFSSEAVPSKLMSLTKINGSYQPYVQTFLSKEKKHSMAFVRKHN